MSVSYSRDTALGPAGTSRSSKQQHHLAGEGFVHSTTETVQSPSGRGKQLTARESAALVGLCNSMSPEGCFTAKTKKFWKAVSEAFEQQTGRLYSWQSCRRRMIKWETPTDGASQPTVPATGLIESSNAGSHAESSVVEEGHSADEDGSDSDLPFTPKVRRDLHTHLNQENSVLRTNVVELVNNGLETFETQLQLYVAAITTDPDDRLRINLTYTHFRDQMREVVNKYEKGRR
ncbi:hypothetical protein N7539_002154 [Penicillium diatomitis]|uniref:Uncharacterized protein n=1 Tax=Penicillium diatomitis TaxID=2819901 RepID=A0A9W9XIB9_9EURO|nr:uncharacterized protein N7539_002154 [Penicillium diatomitis]KAJ5493408.1 hypothetical protein N7539_002154 [Penicillium diatomitis]